MKVGSFFPIAIVALYELGVASARATIQVPRGLSSIDGLGIMAPEGIMRWIQRRQSSTGTLPSSPGDMNTTIADACITTLGNITDISNEAGMAACYNILQHDVSQGTFQADLRLYQVQQPSGPFSGVAVSQMLVNLVYPSSTTFTLLKKRSLTARASDSPMSELQQYSLAGTFTSTVDATKLNQTELMALMLPAIKVVAANPNAQSQASTDITTTDIAFFVVGDFQNQFSPSLTGTALQKEAIIQSSNFTLPGTSLGIFPTGLIITCSWALLFFIAYGVGTIGRFQHRSFYRRRIAAVRGRTGVRF